MGPGAEAARERAQDLSEHYATRIANLSSSIGVEADRLQNIYSDELGRMLNHVYDSFDPADGRFYYGTKFPEEVLGCYGNIEIFPPTMFPKPWLIEYLGLRDDERRHDIIDWSNRH